MARDDLAETMGAVQPPVEALILPVDCREGMRLCLAPKSVHCVVTSPPYFGLRNYGTGRWEGGDPDCPHSHAWVGATAGNLVDDYTRRHVTAADEAKSLARNGGQCRCGAVLADRQIGQEQTPEEYVAALVDVFREVWRVLRDDGTVWLNLGDSYAGSGKGVWNASEERKAKVKETYRPSVASHPSAPPPGLKSKDLIGIPWRVAFALQADGWYLRQDIIWAKPNPMPESVTDRCTKAHEYIFLLTKSPRYYFDALAIAEPLAASSIPRLRPAVAAQVGTTRHVGKTNGNFKAQGNLTTGLRNKRSVWTVTTKPFKGAHFATFPPDLIEPCILAGSPAACCATCGAPRTPVYENAGQRDQRPDANVTGRYQEQSGRRDNGTHKSGGFSQAIIVPMGYALSCQCNAPDAPAVVLDPFGGAGTTALVARRLGRSSVSFDLNPEYCAMAEARLAATAK